MTYTYQTIVLGPQQSTGIGKQLNDLGSTGFRLVSLVQNAAGGVIAVMEKANPPAGS